MALLLVTLGAGTATTASAAQTDVSPPPGIESEFAFLEDIGHFITVEGDIRAVGVDANNEPISLPFGSVDITSDTVVSELAHLNFDSDDDISPLSVIGSDGRTQVTSTTSTPYRGIVHITRDGAAHCTGFLVSPNTVVTAGHCLHGGTGKDWISGLSFIPGRNGSSQPYGSASYTSRWVDTTWISSSNKSQDWGIVKLNTSFSWYFSMAWQDASYNGTTVTITGYPGDKTLGTMWTMPGLVTSSLPNNLCYTIDTEEGQSGSPVYKSGNVVIGIHTYGVFTGSPCGTNLNMATRITQSLYNLITSK